MSRHCVLFFLFCSGVFAAQSPAVIKLPDGVELYGAMPVGSQTKFWLQLKSLLMQWDIRSKPPFQRSVAFLVGVSDYRALKKLPGVDNDLNRMRDYLLNKGGFDQVYVARGAAATPKIVQKYMMNVFHDSLGSEDRLLFYYSGHGDDPGGLQPHLQFAGFTGWEDVDQILRVDTYETWSKRLPVKHALFMFDACLAGIVTSPKTDERAEQHRQLLEALSGNGSRIVVTAGTGDQKAWYVDEYKGKGRSLFTEFFLKALESGSADKDDLGFMTIKQVVAETQTMAANFARGKPGETVLPQDEPFETLGRDGTRNPNRKGTFVFLNTAIKTPNVPPDVKTTMNLSPKGGGPEADREFADKEAYEHWIYIKDKNNEQLFQEHIDRFSQSHFLTFAKLEVSRIKNSRPVTDASKLPFVELREQAVAGNIAAAAELGIRYLDGANGADKNILEAETWLERAAKQEHPDASYRLGRLFYYGATGLAPDTTSGIDWIQKADLYGSGAASWFLGNSYQRATVGFQRDEKKAVELFERGVARGNRDAMTSLGIMYQNGRGGLPKDNAQAVKLYRKAVDAGDARGMADLGNMYRTGGGGLPKDEAEALSWYRKAADAGNGVGMANIGLMFVNGLGGLPKDEVEAVSWYRRSAEAGDAHGMFHLATMYEKGRGGLPKDEAQAVSWYRKAADAGDTSGMAYLGNMYENGKGGLKKDQAQAVSLYRKAAELDNTYAEEQLKRLGQQ